VADRNQWDPPTVRLVDEDSESTSGDEAPGLEPLHADVTHNRTLRVEVRTRLKVRRCKLSISGGPQAGAELISEKERIRIGTHATNDLVVTDRACSRQHCEIQYTDRGYLLVDLESTNGTFVDGKRVERVFLMAGATLTLGTTPISFTPLNEEIEVEPMLGEDAGAHADRRDAGVPIAGRAHR